MVPTTKYLSSRNLRAVSLASLLFVYPVVALSFFAVSYIETVHRLTILQVFDSSLFGSIEADSLAAVGFGLLFLGASSRRNRVRIVFGIIFAASVATYAMHYGVLLYEALAILPAICLLLTAVAIADRRSPRGGDVKRMPVDARHVAIAFLGIVIIMEAFALARWIAYPATPGEIYSDASWHMAELESALFHTFSVLSPVMLVLLVFSYPARVFFKDLFRGSKTEKVSTNDLRAISEKIKKDTGKADYRTGVSASNESVIQQFSPAIEVTKPQGIGRAAECGILVGSMVLAIAITMYPHLPGVNISGSGISTDERAYLEAIEQLRAAGSIDGFVNSAFNSYGGDRPLSLLAIAGLADVTGLSDETVIRFLPAILGPGLVVSVFSLVRFGLADSPFFNHRRSIAITAAVAAAVSPQIVVGMYGGFLANWMALITAFASILFAIRLFDHMGEGKQGRGTFLFAGALFLALSCTMLFHVYTWGFTIVGIGLFVAISALSSLRMSGSRRSIVLQTSAIAISVLIASVAADFLKSEYFGQATGLSRDSLVIGSNFDFSNFDSRWDTLAFTLHNYLGGFLSNPIIFALALLWAFRSNTGNNLNKMIFASLILLSIPILFGNHVMQARLLHVVPTFVPAVLGAFTLGRNDKRLSVFIAVALVLSMSVYALRAGANFDLVVPADFHLDNPFLVP